MASKENEFRDCLFGKRRCGKRLSPIPKFPPREIWAPILLPVPLSTISTVLYFPLKINKDDTIRADMDNQLV